MDWIPSDCKATFNIDILSSLSRKSESLWLTHKQNTIYTKTAVFKLVLATSNGLANCVAVLHIIIIKRNCSSRQGSAGHLFKLLYSYESPRESRAGDNSISLSLFSIRQPAKRILSMIIKLTWRKAVCATSQGKVQVLKKQRRKI